MSSEARGVHEISNRYVEELAALDPITATSLGIPVRQQELTDYSPDGHRARGELARRTLADMSAAEPADDAETVAKAVFTERVGLDVELHDAGADMSSLNVIASPVQELRQVFDLMPGDTSEQWHDIAKRMSAMPGAVKGLIASLRESAANGEVSAARQVKRVAEQCDTWSGRRDGGSFFADMVTRSQLADPGLRSELDTAASLASEAYSDLADFLRTELLPQAPAEDAVGEQRYRLWSRYFTGADLDLREAYEWGWNEFASIEAEMKRVAGRIKPSATLAEAAAALDADPRYRVHGQRGLAEWMQRLSDQALRELRETQFDIPERLMNLECRIAPPGGGTGAYYTPPTDDFSRPGRMWRSVPPDKEEYSTWREVSTVYHEGAPGHHLQIATAVDQAQRLNKFQRLACIVSAHAEGWALYAERLMRELGYLSDDGDLLGMLNEQLFRAARVIVDIGMHLQLPIPAGTGFHEGEIWTPELGLEFMLTRTITDTANVRDEIDRYLGWPGQAPSYKLGERLWLSAREDARARHGAEFDLKRFHRQALEMGSMGLDTLREQLARL
ncbi:MULTISPECIES: DUF885 domain-containing protein [Actinopolyspora]|uniref:DUF885 domain-containing protein n=1 Tax=Actinopolyspora TaxID=1849 RepID=UPI000B83DE8F|nr:MULTISPECIES: DUF885 domain-containing protein [Actinopolyspora]NHD17371.1 DUF885 domain-containing protein [Actinopolyspora sp. BKK2]NHE76896.1 DUF885 domain-containing protein [Actinopolyspora sp. BKK1]